MKETKTHNSSPRSPVVIGCDRIGQVRGQGEGKRANVSRKDQRVSESPASGILQTRIFKLDLCLTFK